jgi:hypothetical protein
VSSPRFCYNSCLIQDKAGDYWSEQGNRGSAVRKGDAVWRGTCRSSTEGTIRQAKLVYAPFAVPCKGPVGMHPLQLEEVLLRADTKQAEENIYGFRSLWSRYKGPQSQ